MIKTLLAFCSILIFASCQKELSYENNIPTPGNNTAVYTLGATGANCSGVVLAGTYTNGIATNAGNTAQIQVNVTTAGAYSITTSTIAGVNFSASGSFTSTGAQTVTLTTTGKPTADGVETFSVTAGTNTCNFDIPFAKPAPPAVFTFAGAPSACTMPVINGIYSATTAVSPSNTVVVKVNVTTVGSYNIVTNVVNGLSFSASGVFTATGDVTVTLYAAGTPLAAGATTLKFDGASSCSFDVPVAAAPVVTGTYSCKIDGVLTTFTELAAAEKVDALTSEPELYLDGYKDANHDAQFQIFISNNDQSVVLSGTYDGNHYVPTSPTSLGYRIEVDYTAQNADLSTTIWNTASVIPIISPNNPAFTITVTSITASRAKGTFSGKLTNTLQGGTLFKTITEGVFDLPIQ